MSVPLYALINRFYNVSRSNNRQVVWLIVLPIRKAINPLYLMQHHIGSAVQLSQIRLFGSLWTIVRYWRFLNLGGLSSPVYVHVETKLKRAIGHAGYIWH